MQGRFALWRHGATALLLSVALAAPAVGETLGYRCSIKRVKSNDWIQPLIFIAHDTVTNRIVASDAVILAYNDGQPVEARLVANNTARVTFAWTVEAVLQASPVEISYRATYLKRSGKVNVFAQALGFNSNFNAGGTCEVKPIKT